MKLMCSSLFKKDLFLYTLVIAITIIIINSLLKLINTKLIFFFLGDFVKVIMNNREKKF